MNLDKILESVSRKNDTITRIYYGGDHCCRCGCKGHYANRGTPLFRRYLKKIESTALAGVVEADLNWVNLPVEVSTEVGKCFTLYFEW